MTQSMVDMYAKAAGVSHWPTAGKMKAVELIDWGFRRPVEHNVLKDGLSIPIPNSKFGAFSSLQREYVQNNIFKCPSNFNVHGLSTMAWQIKQRHTQTD